MMFSGDANETGAAILPSEAAKFPSYESRAVDDDAIHFRRPASRDVFDPTEVEVQPDANGFCVRLLKCPVLEENLRCFGSIVKMHGKVESFLSSELRRRRKRIVSACG